MLYYYRSADYVKSLPRVIMVIKEKNNSMHRFSFIWGFMKQGQKCTHSTAEHLLVVFHKPLF